MVVPIDGPVHPCGYRPIAIDEQCRRCREADLTLVHALIRACRWNRWLSEGKYQDVKAIAQHERINSPSYASRLLRLTLLAPDIQKAILNSTYPPHLTLAEFMDPFPYPWPQQREQFGF